jgi:methylglyoxal synthase
MGRRVKPESEVGRLVVELKSVAKKDWHETNAFDFDELPILAGIFGLSGSSEDVKKLKVGLLRVRNELAEEEEGHPQPNNRPLADGVTIFLRLSDEWAGKTMEKRQEGLRKVWRNRDGTEIASAKSVRSNHQADLWYGFAERLLREPGAAAATGSGRRLKPKPMPPVAAAPWPVKGHEPSQGQEIVILMAARAFREGPTSGLARLVREFEPYWRASEAMIYSLEGSYKEIWKAGLLQGYEHFVPLPAGFEGGLVHATEVVVAADERGTVCHVVYLVDPHDNSSLYPATASIKRECLLTGTPFLSTHQGAARWFRLEWARRAAEEKGLKTDGLLLPWPARGLSGEAAQHGDGSTLALAAHDRHKRSMMDFVDANVNLFERDFPQRWATRVTGHVLNGGSIWDYEKDVLYDVKGEKRTELMKRIEDKSFEWEAEERSSGPGSPGWVQQLTRGRHGGVIQLARRVLNEECGTIVFFQDAEAASEQDMEIQVLDRAAQLASRGALLLYDERSATRWAENLAACRDPGGAFDAVTLVKAYRDAFDVELVLAHPAPAQGNGRNRRSAEATRAVWHQITRTAAIHLVGTLSAMAKQKSEGEPVRFGFHWGGAVRDILGELSGTGDPNALAGALALHHYVKRHEAGELARATLDSLLADESRPAPLPLFGPDELKVVPTVGVIGAKDRSQEAHSLVFRATEVLGGDGVLFPESAFALKGGVEDPLGRRIDGDWGQLDVLLLSAAPLQARGKAALATALPSDLASFYKDCAAAVGTIYLERDADGGEVKQPQHPVYEQVGITPQQIGSLKDAGSEVVLVNGAELKAPRIEACWAALKAELASTLISDRAFAWEVLKREVPNLESLGDAP